MSHYSFNLVVRCYLPANLAARVWGRVNVGIGKAGDHIKQLLRGQRRAAGKGAGRGGWHAERDENPGCMRLIRRPVDVAGSGGRGEVGKAEAVTQLVTDDIHQT